MTHLYPTVISSPNHTMPCSHSRTNLSYTRGVEKMVGVGDEDTQCKCYTPHYSSVLRFLRDLHLHAWITDCGHANIPDKKVPRTPRDKIANYHDASDRYVIFDKFKAPTTAHQLGQGHYGVCT